MKKKKRNKYQLEKIDKYQKLIEKHKDDLWKPEKGTFLNEEQIDFKNNIPKTPELNTQEEKVNYKSFDVYLSLSREQREIILRWLNAVTIMYNETIKFIRSTWNNFYESKVEYENLKRTFKYYDNECEIIDTRNEEKIKDRVTIGDEFLNLLRWKLRVAEEKYEENLLWFTQSCNFRYCRTHLMQHVKKNIAIKSYSIFSDKTKPKNFAVPSNILDQAIFEACTNFKTSADLFLQRKIKKFRMKTKGFKRQSRTLKIDKSIFDNNNPFLLSLGDSIYCHLENQVPIHISQINSSCTLIYNKKNNIFKLNVSQCEIEKKRKSEPENLINALLYKNEIHKDIKSKIPFQGTLITNRMINSLDKYSTKENGKLEKKFEVKNYNPEHKILSLDPGLRTFMTGLTEKKVFEFGTDIYKKIKNQYTKLYRAKIPLNERKKKKKIRRGRKKNKKGKVYQRKQRKKKELTEYRYKKLQKRTSRRISNMVDGLHHSICDQVAKNIKETVILGNMSSKSIISNERSKLSNTAKRITQRLKFYQFKLRLRSKCEKHNLNFVFVDESYTSITCSSCGFINDELGASKTFKCPNKVCGITFDRDVNACRGIYIKSLDVKNHRH